MAEEQTTGGSGGFFDDVTLKDILGAAGAAYAENQRRRVGSGGNQTPVTQPADAPAPATITPQHGGGSFLSDLPPWSKQLLGFSVLLLIGAVAYKALK